MKLTHAIAAATTAAVIGSLGVSIAGATSGQVDPPTTSAPASPDAARRPGVRVLAGALETAAHAIGISRRDLRQELRDGGSIAAVATAHGVELQAVVDALVAAGTQKIDEARAAGRISEERASKLTEALPGRAEQFVNRERQGRAPRRQAAVRSALDTAAAAIGIEREDLVDALRAGTTIAAVAQQHGVDPQVVVDQLTEAANKRIADRHEARVAALEERAQRRISKYVNEWMPRAAQS
jgi:hypothetical protein